MADAVTTHTIADYAKSDEIIVVLTCLSDGTGETNVVKVDKSGINTAPDGAEPAALDIVRIQWHIGGFSYLKLSWDHTTDDTALVLPPGSGYHEFHNSWGRTPLLDPRSAGGTGDLLLSTGGPVSGAAYTLFLTLKKADN